MPSLRRFVHILFEVILSNALFITTVNFTFLNHDMSKFYNVVGKEVFGVHICLLYYLIHVLVIFICLSILSTFLDILLSTRRAISEFFWHSYP